MNEVRKLKVGKISIDVISSNEMIESFDSTFPSEDIGPGLHYHTKMDEIFHVLSGKFLISRADEQITATAGMTIHIPKKTVHGFKSLKPSRILVTFIPGGNQLMYLTELGQLSESGSSWKDGISELQKKYDCIPV